MAEPMHLAMRAGLAAIVLGIAVDAAAGQSLFDHRPFARELDRTWHVSADLLILPDERIGDPYDMVAAPAAPAQHWRSEFNPLNLAHAGGNGFINLTRDTTDDSPQPPAPATLALAGLGLATIVGGRPRPRKVSRPRLRDATQAKR